MLSKKHNLVLMVFILLVSGLSFGQSVKRLVPYDGTSATYLVAQIRADTTANHGILADRIYELDNGGIYLNTELFNVAAGKTIRMRAPKGIRPIIYQYPTGTGANPQNPPGNLFVLIGGNLEMTNIAVSGIFEPVATNIANVQGGLINTTGVGSSIKIDNCVLTNINGQHIRTGSAAKTIKVTNSIFANMGSLTSSNFGAGKGLDLREVSVDTLILQHNTFVNSQDRIVRHLNLAAGNTVTGILDYTLIDHNTFVNGMGFHGLLSLGNVGSKVTITNNLFVDAYALGQDSLDVTRSVEFNNTGEKYVNGNNKMPWIFTAPNETTIWQVKNNYYSISSAGQNFFTSNPRHSEGSILTSHIQFRLGFLASQAFTKINIALMNIPALMTKLMNYYISPTGGNYTKDKPGYSYLVNDMDRRVYKYFTDTLDCSYSSSSLAYTGSSTGGRVGSLYWFNGKQPVSVEKTEGLIPTTFALDQNYPNPFNPTTKISYSIPKESNVKLEVFDILGKRVAELVNERQQVGQYSINFDASRFSSGVYLYRLSSDGYTFSKKMMLMK